MGYRIQQIESQKAQGANSRFSNTLKGGTSASIALFVSVCDL